MVAQTDRWGHAARRASWNGGRDSIQSACIAGQGCRLSGHAHFMLSTRAQLAARCGWAFPALGTLPRAQATRVLTAAVSSVRADFASAKNMLVFGSTYSSLSIPA